MKRDRIGLHYATFLHTSVFPHKKASKEGAHMKQHDVQSILLLRESQRQSQENTCFRGAWFFSLAEQKSPFRYLLPPLWMPWLCKRHSLAVRVGAHTSQERDRSMKQRCSRSGHLCVRRSFPVLPCMDAVPLEW